LQHFGAVGHPTELENDITQQYDGRVESDRLGQVVTALGSPLVGGIAGVVFAKEQCTSIPATDGPGSFDFPASQICSEQFNSEIGIILTLIGWAIAGVWFVLTVIGERQSSPPPSAK
jgi:hypothetical protein